MARQIMKGIKKEIRTKQSENSVEALIQRKEWPAGGLLELQNAIREDMYWVYNMAHANGGPTNRSVIGCVNILLLLSRKSGGNRRP